MDAAIVTSLISQVLQKLQFLQGPLEAPKVSQRQFRFKHFAFKKKFSYAVKTNQR